MKVEQSFSIARPVDDVWAFFQNIPEVAACMPGATLGGEIAPRTYAGRISVRLGPFGASFEGEATVSFDQADRRGHAEGKGVDKRGGSRSKMAVDFDVAASGPDRTTVHLDADITLSGAIAQFGRGGIIQETANILIGTFVRNLEARLTAGAPVLAAGPDETAATERPGDAGVPRSGDAGVPRPGDAGAPVRAIGAAGLIVAVMKAWLRRLFGLRQQ